MLLYTYTYEKTVSSPSKNEKQEQAELRFFKETFLPGLVTPILFLNTQKNMEPVFINTEFKTLLTHFSLEVRAFLDSLVVRTQLEVKEFDIEAQIRSRTLFQHLMDYQHLAPMSNYATFSANLQGQNDDSLLCEVKICKGIYDNEDIMCIQLIDLSLKKRLKLLEQSLSYKDHVLNTVAHDLRNPLGAIIGLLGSLERNVIDPRAQELVITCKNTGDMLLNVVNTYLDGSQLKEKKLRVVPVEITLKEYLKEISKVFEFLCKQKNITFFIKFLTRTPRVVITDRHRLTQILFNLVGNAIKFTSKGHVSIIVSVRSSLDSSRQMITFCVQDTGIGISPQNQQKLFQSFSKLEASAKINPYGVGLGLMISNELVGILNIDERNAKIEVESEVGRGSLFSFTISSSLQTSNEPKNLSPERFDNFHLNKEVIDTEQDSMDSDTRNAIEGKMIDYSRDYGRLNGSKFYTPRNKNDSPRSLSILLGDYSWEGAPNTTGRRVTTRGMLTPYIKTGSIDIPGRTLSNKTLVSSRDCQGKYAGFFRGTSIDIQTRISGIEKSKSPIRLSKFKLNTTEKRSLLLVDDNLFNIIAIRHILMEKGFEVTVAMNGRESIEAVREKLKDDGFFQGILMDREMPEMDGLEATIILRSMMENNEIPVVPIIGLTGSEDAETLRQCKEAGMVEVLGKPLSEARLLEILKNSSIKD